jgi:hypothetical protein
LGGSGCGFQEDFADGFRLQAPGFRTVYDGAGRDALGARPRGFKLQAPGFGTIAENAGRWA